MASTFVNDLRLNEMATGDQSGSWGTVTNVNLELIGEALGFGTEAITTNANTHTSTIADGVSDPVRAIFIKYTGTLDSACTITIGPNTVNKFCFIHNATGGSQNIIISQGSGANVTIATGQTKGVYLDGAGSGAAVVDGFATFSVGDLLVDDDLTVTDDITVGGDILIGDAHFIADAAGNEQLVFQTTGSAVNQFEVTNSASSTAFLQGPLLTATGDDTNIDLNLIAKGTGVIAVRGNSASGAVQLNCESNSHGQILQGQPHSAGVTNTMLLPTGANSTLVSLVSADTLTNKTLTSAVLTTPKIADAGFIADANGNELVVFQTTGSAVNQLEITNNASGSNPIIAATGGDTNIGIALTPKGTGEIVIAAGNLNYSGTAVTATGAELNKLAGAGTLKEAGKESIWVPAAAMYPSTTNPCSDLTQVETTALRPDLKVLDFAAAADDFAQFAIAFPKSWNEGTVTYQPFWTVTGTNTGTMVWQLGGIAVSSDDTINTAFGTLVATTALAHSGTSNDLMVSAESGAVTIAGSPAANDLCFFQINNDASASGQTGVARLLGVKLFFTTDAANDA